MSTKSIKLFVDAHAMDREYQGTYTFVHGLYTALLAKYPQVDVYFGTSYPDRLAAAFPQLSKDRILAYKNAKPGILRYLTDIPRYIKTHKFDFAHFQYIIPRSNGRCRYIVTLHDNVFNDFKQYFSFRYRKRREYLFAWSIKNAAIKTTVSAYSKERIANYHQLDECDINILANGVETVNNFNQVDKDIAAKHVFENYGIKNYLLYVSRVEGRKNHQLLLKTWLKLELYKQHISLVFIGKTSVPVAELQAIVNSLTEEQKRYFYAIEQVGPNDLAMFYKACRAFVYPTVAEGFGIPPLEAAMHRVPVLCSSATAMQSFDFFEPYFFDPYKEEEFAAKLQSILRNPPTFAFLENIAEQIQQRYNWQQTADTLYKLLQS
ncbi:glycosyltransferase family 4 protein [Mucilaginibacter agri]|uniref:Glycosyltransferase n=1 Tax=Mucilaginibacter agri TaxID=2695265 RepID=A0A965ZFW7_9SPHI|nr:glycosyltransferase family 1 protein [Mucilaginibacter agri]NCD69047.1 glycosyltransferase [Mucilaginibacter agri]